MNKTYFVISACFLFCFAAGLSTGVLITRVSEPPPREHSWLGSRLKLTPQQREQMARIWSQAAEGPRRGGEQRAAAARQRDQAIAALLTAEQKPQYETILQDYHRQLEQISAERRAAFERARQQTKAILTPEQARRYDDLLKERPGGPGGPDGRGGFRPHHRRGPGSSSQPDSGPASDPQGDFPPPPPPPGEE